MQINKSIPPMGLLCLY